MKKITKKSILQKITISILSIMLLFNFIVPTYSHANFGGILLSPVVDLLCSIGDAIINLLQICMTGEGGNVNFSMSAFLVEDDEFWTNAEYDDYKGKGEGTQETIDPENEFEKGWFGVSDKYHIPTVTYSPEQIFAGKVPGLDINFINPNGSKIVNIAGKDVEINSAQQLQGTIASWYVAIRNLAVVGLLSILVYVGIRIIISSTASDKAKYKQILVDWLIALCILFFMHYIMSFILTMTESVCNAIGGNGDSTITVNIEGEPDKSFKTNLLGLARFKTQYKDFGPKMAYLIMYLALVVYTVVFTWFYLKRLLMMAFLTLIAPAVALTYPIDKMNDGKAQAFDAWLKEYAFNALIQPFHLIIYYVFVTSAMDLASTNIIYMIAALGFIMPAEKILRKFFGFDKAGAGTLGALAGGLTAGSLISKLGKGKSRGGSSGKASNENNGEEEKRDKSPRFEKKHDVGQIEGGQSNDDNLASEENNQEDASQQEALDKYSADGYGQNANGEYFNPWTDEYDANYDPTKDAAYATQQNDENDQNDNSTKEDNDTNDKNDKKPNMFSNWTRAHGITPKSVGKAGLRKIGGVAKFATRTAFKAGIGTLAGAVALASGGGFAGASAAFMAGSKVGGAMGNAVTNAGGKVVGATIRMGQGTAGFITGKGHRMKAFNDAVWGGTKIGRELDLAHGNTRYQDAASAKQFKTDKNNLQYLRDQMTAENGGAAPSAKEVKEKMKSFDPYLAEGMTNIKDIMKAQKVAKNYGISDKQSAIIAAIGKEKGITADVLNDDKKAKAQQANLRQEFINKGQSAQDATRQANYTINVLKAQNGVAHNLKKK